MKKDLKEQKHALAKINSYVRGRSNRCLWMLDDKNRPYMRPCDGMNGGMKVYHDDMNTMEDFTKIGINSKKALICSDADIFTPFEVDIVIDADEIIVYTMPKAQ